MDYIANWAHCLFYQMIPSLKGKAQSRSGERPSSNSEADLINSLEDENTGTGSQSHEDKEMHDSCRLGVCDFWSLHLLNTGNSI